MRTVGNQKVCMSDYEYAAFEQREEENAANESFRFQLANDREAERRRLFKKLEHPPKANKVELKHS